MRKQNCFIFSTGTAAAPVLTAVGSGSDAKGSEMNILRNRVTQWWSIFLVSALVLASSGCHSSPAVGDPVSEVPVAPVVQPQRGALSNRLKVAGELLPYQEVELHAKVSGYIRKIYVDIGDRVHKGEVLADLDIPELAAQVDEAKSGVQRSEQDILRAKSAVARAEDDHSALHSAYTRLKQAAAAQPGLVAQQELDDAQAKDSSSEAEIDAAKANLSAMQQGLAAAKANHLHYSSLADYAHITAPYSGVVTWRYSDTGALVQAGTSSAGAQPVVKLAQTDILRLRLPVPEALAGYVRIGDTAQIRIEATGEILTGKVVRTTGELDMATRTLQVEIDLNNADRKLSPGMYADVTLDIQRTGSGLTVPIQAVDRTTSQPFALVVDSQDRIEKRPVRLGLQDPNRVEVVSGISDGDHVVVANLSSFKAGESVRPQTVSLPQIDAGNGKAEE
jgi:RND family efflux transporter MFP subunit